MGWCNDMTTIVDNIITALGSTYGAFTKGSPYNGQSYESLYTNHVKWTREMGYDNSVVRWEIMFEYFADTSSAGDTLLAALPALFAALASPPAVVGPYLHTYRDPVPINGGLKHWNTIRVSVWEK
jgi:hypothetical protein